MTTVSSRCHEASPRSSDCGPINRSWENPCHAHPPLVASSRFWPRSASVAAAAEGSAAPYTLRTRDQRRHRLRPFCIRRATGRAPFHGRSGGPLGSQGAVVTTTTAGGSTRSTPQQRHSVFKVTEDGLVWSDRVASADPARSGVTTSHDLVYVVMPRATHRGLPFGRREAEPIGARSDVHRSGAAQIQFSPSGRAIVVTEKTTSTLDAFVVGRTTRGSATAYASSGTTPFGFASVATTTSWCPRRLAPHHCRRPPRTSSRRTARLRPSAGPSRPRSRGMLGRRHEGRRYAFTANAASDSYPRSRSTKRSPQARLRAGRPLDRRAHTDMSLTETQYLYANDGGTHMISLSASKRMAASPPSGAAIPGGASGLARARPGHLWGVTGDGAGGLLTFTLLIVYPRSTSTRAARSAMTRGDSRPWRGSPLRLRRTQARRRRREWLHIIDLDGSRTQARDSITLRAIANRFTVKIQRGGGIRDFDTAEAFAEAGRRASSSAPRPSTTPSSSPSRDRTPTPCRIGRRPQWNGPRPTGGPRRPKSVPSTSCNVSP